MSPRRIASRLTCAVLALLVWTAGPARADWTTYHGDAVRSGVDSSSGGSLAFTGAWTSPSLTGAIYAEPLVHAGLVIVATESDQVMALDESTGHVVWQASAGTPVPASQLPCGDIDGTVGITSTPVIDPATNRVFVLADTWDGSNILHRLYAFDVSTGTAVVGFPVSAEPPGDVPAAQLQRAALALDNGQIIAGYGGNAGDCSTYHGWLVAVPESGGPEHTFEVESGANEGAIWGSGDGPAVEPSGNIWAASGNGSGSTYGYQQSVLKLGPSLNLLDAWAPSDWQSLDSSDRDIGSTEPLLLPGALVFQIGKEGLGYLLSATGLGGTGAAPVFQASVCSGSYGGAAYSGGVIYVPCSDGLRALTVDTATRSFAPLASWHVPSSANGPPILSGGLVWATDWSHAALYGMNPQTGQAVVTQSTAPMEHFTTPAASDGKLFLATGQTVEAYTIADAAPSAVVGPSAPAPKCVLRLRSAHVKVHHPTRRPHGRHAPPPFATVSLMAKCDQAVSVSVSGRVTERLDRRAGRRGPRLRALRLRKVSATLEAGAARTLQVRIGPVALRALQHRIRVSASFTLTSSGSVSARARARLRL
jgi:outer membrane protein assembly factor BamB